MPPCTHFHIRGSQETLGPCRCTDDSREAAPALRLSRRMIWEETGRGGGIVVLRSVFGDYRDSRGPEPIGTPSNSVFRTSMKQSSL